MNGSFDIKNRLCDTTFTCVLEKDGELLTSTEKGIRPLVGFLESGKDLSGFFAADRIVGRAAAFLYIMMKVGFVYGEVMSRGAVELFEKNKTPYEYSTLTEAIINRNKTGLCPMETAVMNDSDCESAYADIKKMLEVLNSEK